MISPRVFISYSRKDGENFATELRQKLEKENIPLWQDRIGEEGGRDWWLQCVDALNKVEFMVLVMTPAAMTSPTVRREWRHARQQGVCVYPVKGVPDEQLDYSSLPRFMRDAHFYELKHDWQKFLNDLNTRCRTPRVPFMAEDLPPDFIDRPEEYEQLIARLLDEKQENPVAITAALRGAGGYGKTTLARAICHDERIQDAFDDGTLWVTLGEHPGDLTPKVIDLIEILSDERPGFSDAQAAASRLTELLADRDLLLVIDDVWNSAHTRPFLQGGKRCARLITTRNSDTLPPKAKQINLDAMKKNEAVRLLGFDLPGGEETALQALAKRLGEWPQLLKLVNATLRERVTHGQSLTDALSYVNKALDKRGLTAFDARDPQAREQAVNKTLDVSLELLREDERIRYNELAIFPEDTDVHLTTVQKLWQQAGLDELDSEDLCQQFYRLSLLLQFDLASRTIRLHDIIRSYLQGQQKKVLAEIHARFLQAYGVENWWELPSGEPYIWEHLAYHLRESGQDEALRRLLLDYRWLVDKLAAAGVNSLLADYDLLREEENLRLLQSALRLSANQVTQDPAQLSGHLLGRLQSFPTSAFETLLHQAKTLPNSPWLRPLFATLTPPGGPLIRTLEGHGGGIFSVALSGDGNRVLSGSYDHTLKLWDLESGETLRTLKGHSGVVNSVALSADGNRALSGSSDHTLKLWDLESGEALLTLKGHSGGIFSVALNGDRNRALSGSDDHTLKLWDLERKEVLLTLQGHRGGVNSVALSADGNRALSGSDDNTLKLWDLESGEALLTLKGHSGGVLSVALSGDGNRALSGSGDQTLKLWDLESGEALRTLQGHSRRVFSVVLNGDGNRALSGSLDYTLKLWDLESGEALRTLKGHGDWVRSVALSRDENRALSGSDDNTLKFWDISTSLDTGLESGEALRTLKGHSGWVASVALSGDGKRALSGAPNQTLKLWDLESGEALCTLKGHSGWVASVALSGDGKRALSGSSDQTVKVWDIECNLKNYFSLKNSNILARKSG